MGIDVIASVTYNDTIFADCRKGADEGDYGRGGVNILNLPSFTWPTQLSRFTQLSQSRTANEIHEQRPAG